MYSFGRCPISLIVIFEAQFQKNPNVIPLFIKCYIYNVHNWPAGLVFTFGCNHLGNSISNQRTMFAVCGLHIMCTLYNFNFQSSMDVISRCPNFQFFFRNKMLTGGIWINFFLTIIPAICNFISLAKSRRISHIASNPLVFSHPQQITKQEESSKAQVKKKAQSMEFGC